MISGNFLIFEFTESLQEIDRLLKSEKMMSKTPLYFEIPRVKLNFKWMRGRLCRWKVIIYFSIHIHQKNKRNIWVHRLDLLYFKLIIGLLMLGDELFNQWLTNQIEPVSLKLFGRFSVYRTSLNYRIIERVIIDSKVFRQLLTILFSV